LLQIAAAVQLFAGHAREGPPSGPFAYEN